MLVDDEGHFCDSGHPCWEVEAGVVLFWSETRRRVKCTGGRQVGWVTVKVHGRALRFALSRRVARALPSGQPPNRHLRNHHGHRLELHPLVCSLQGRKCSISWLLWASFVTESMVHDRALVRIQLNNHRDASDVLPASVTVVGDEASSSSAGAICRLGLLRSSSVTPSSFVMPTIGASPLFTNSHWPATLSAIISLTY